MKRDFHILWASMAFEYGSGTPIETEDEGNLCQPFYHGEFRAISLRTSRSESTCRDMRTPCGLDFNSTSRT